MDAARAAGVDLGIGGGRRSIEDQFSLFDSRHNIVDVGGCCSYDGKSWAVIPGAAHAAPPGLSYHEDTVELNGRKWAVALDMVGWQNGWMEKNLAAYGLKSFANGVGAGQEPWHIQPVELPNSRRGYSPMLHTLRTWDLPLPPKPPQQIDVPLPTIRLGSSGGEVRELQQHCTFWKWYGFRIDGSCGPQTVEAIKKMQIALKLTVDGVYGPKTADAYKKWLQSMSGM